MRSRLTLRGKPAEFKGGLVVTYQRNSQTLILSHDNEALRWDDKDDKLLLPLKTVPAFVNLLRLISALTGLSVSNDGVKSTKSGWYATLV